MYHPPILLFLSLLFTLPLFLTSTRAQESLQVACGSDGEILHNSTLAGLSGEHDIKTTLRTCPGFANKSANSSVSRGLTAPTKKRDFVQCTPLDCAEVVCANFTYHQPQIADCEYLTKAVMNLGNITVPMTSLYQVTFNTCSFEFANEDQEDYIVCWLDFTLNSLTSAERCFGNYPSACSTAGAQCRQSVPENTYFWRLQIVYPYSGPGT
ncbi:hypothetical protein DENSPDRAFT_930500 [Dentipellis sp. KUC8613]|nr:hypothetical protein DENSPDRAFT_930500 [Dentipellis sp. KUC8613]